MRTDGAMMRITILGSGTSTGVPVIGCNCKVCISGNARNKRTRSSALISLEGGNILIDTSTDLRCQSLKNGIRSLKAVLFTHPHADHVHGIDELRSFNFLQRESIPCYGNSNTLDRIRTMFSYIFNGETSGGGIPRLTMNEVNGIFELCDITVTPVEVIHGKLPILGYRLSNTAYITDCSEIPSSSMKKLEGLELLILGALRYREHSTHFTIDEAIGIVETLKPQKTVFTHLSHEIEYARTTSELPAGVELAYDGMILDVDV